MRILRRMKRRRKITKRKSNEDYEDCRKRRVEDQKKIKIYLKARAIWNPKIQGTYRRKEFIHAL
jgi:hypothetical protein